MPDAKPVQPPAKPVSKAMAQALHAMEKGTEKGRGIALPSLPENYGPGHSEGQPVDEPLEPIRVHSDWGWWDQLAGRTLHDGERLRICWPDGSETVETIAIDRGTRTVGDMGHDYEAPIERAFVKAQHRGREVTVYLAGLVAQRVYGG